MSYKMSMLLCGVVLIFCCAGVLLIPTFIADKPAFYYSPDQEESYTVGSLDQLQIRRIYRLTPIDDPVHIPIEDFELNGWNYHMVRMDKEELEGKVTYTVIFNGTKTRGGVLLGAGFTYRART